MVEKGKHVARETEKAPAIIDRSRNIALLQLQAILVQIFPERLIRRLEMRHTTQGKHPLLGYHLCVGFP